MYNDLYSTGSLVDETVASTALWGSFFGIMIFSLILSLIIIISYWKIFNKAGKPGWVALIPVYNYIVMIQIAKLPIWYIILFFIPVVNIYILFKINIEMAKKFGKSSGYGIGMTLLSVIFVPLLAFSDSVYEEMKIDANTNPNNTFDATNVINSNASESVNINTVNQFNTIEENIPIEPSSVVEPIEQVIDESINSNPIVEDVNIVKDEIIDIPSEPVNIVSEVSETLDNSVNDIPVFEPTVETVENISIVPEIPETNVVEEMQEATQNIVESEPIEVVGLDNNIQNAFNSTPIMTEPIKNVTETLNTNNDVIQDIPNIEPVNTEVIETPISVESLEQKKVCKNCGNELPNIVSICPNCGTDNE